MYWSGTTGGLQLGGTSGTATSGALGTGTVTVRYCVYYSKEKYRWLLDLYRAQYG